MTVADVNIEASRAWIGRRGTCTDLVTSAPLAALAATLDKEDKPC